MFCVVCVQTTNSSSSSSQVAFGSQQPLPRTQNMSFQVSAIPLRNSNLDDNNRASAHYHPSIWGDHFLRVPYNSKLSDGTIEREHKILKQDVRRLLITDEPFGDKLALIDAVQRLGVGYHLTSEIEDELQKLFVQDLGDEDDHLCILALRFRLLRQQGIRAPCDVFEKFRDCKLGSFKEAITSDVAGMLSLYEAAFMGVRGETILDDALTFATKKLQEMLTWVSPNIGEEIRYALNRPTRKCLPRLDARHFMDAYSRIESHNHLLLKFAKLDFTILQDLHQKELSAITRWWVSLDAAKKLPFARDRIVELYFWIMGVYFEPQYSLARTILTKVIAMGSILDDTYDNFGTFKELELLTQVIPRWDYKAIDILPERMKLICSIVFDTYIQIEEELVKEGRPHFLQYAKEAMNRLVQNYLVEAKWREEGYIPSVEEYMEAATFSCAYPLLATTSFVGMLDMATKQVFEWVSNDPKVVKASSIICRLMDDIVSHEREQERDHVASGIECYMKQHEGVSREEVVTLFREEVRDAWKDINEECLRPTVVAMPFLERVLNLSRAMDVIYKDGDGYTNSHILKHHVSSLIMDPVPLF